MSSQTKNKTIFLIGAGPGDPELLTLKAVKILQQADCVLYDKLVHPQILEFCPQAEKICVGKGNGVHPISQEQIHELLQKKIQEHDQVVRLKGGDPFVFARGGEELEFLQKKNYHVEIIPGITAALGAAASLGLPLTHRDYASQLIFITGHKRQEHDYKDFRELSLDSKTLVVYMGVTALPQIVEALLQNPNSRSYSAMVIANATIKNLSFDNLLAGKEERYAVAALTDIVNVAKQKKISPPALLIVGAIVGVWQASRNEHEKNFREDLKNN